MKKTNRGFQIQLAVSALGGLPGAQVYHSSILMDGLEFSFGAIQGLVTAKGALSHSCMAGQPELFDLGFSQRTPRQLATTLGPFFKRGTYDLLRKNCNTFADCAINFLLGQRLDAKYRSLDQLGANVPGLVQMGSFGFYKPNPAAIGFDVEAVVQSLSKSGVKDADTDAPTKVAAGAAWWEAAGQLLEAAGDFWSGRSQVPQVEAPEPEQLKQRLRAKEAARARNASSRIGGA